MCWEDVEIYRSQRVKRTTLTLANGVQTRFPGNPNRMSLWVTQSALGGAFVSDDPAVTTSTGIPVANSITPLNTFHIRDYGQFVTGDLYFTAGAGQAIEVWETILDVLVISKPARRESV